LGFIFRQGGIPFLANTRAWKKSLAGIKPAFQSDAKFEKFVDEMHNDARRKTLEASGVEFETIGDEVSFNEEFLSTVAGKIPLVKQSNRAHSLTTDLFRFNVGNQVFAEIDKMQMPDEEKERAKEFLAKKWVNIITGKGYVGGLYSGSSPAGKIVSSALGAPRFAIANFQVLYYTNPVRLAFLPKGARKIVAKATLRIYTPLALTFATLGALGLVSLDPEDKDFLIIRGNRIAELTGLDFFKDQHLDILGGKKEPLRLAAGLPLKAIFYALTGNAAGYRRVYKETMLEIFSNDSRFSPFFRGKLHPTLGLITNLVSGEDIGGQPYSVSDVPADFFLPILLKEILGAGSYDKKKNILHEQSRLDWKRENAGRVISTLLLSLIGVGVGNYPKRETTTAYKQALVESNFRGGDDAPNEEIKRRQVKAGLKRLIREGEDVSKEIERYQKAGVIDEKDVEAVNEAKDTSAIEDTLRNADENAVRRVLRFATRRENWLNDRIDEAETERLALENLFQKKEGNAQDEADSEKRRRAVESLVKEGREKQLAEVKATPETVAIENEIKDLIREGAGLGAIVEKLKPHIKSGAITAKDYDRILFDARIDELIEVGKLTPTDENEILDRLEEKDELYKIRTGGGQEAAQTFEKAMRARNLSQPDRQALIEEMQLKFDNSDSENTRIKLRRAALKFGINLDKE
jgi:hypothetical protein